VYALATVCAPRLIAQGGSNPPLDEIPKQDPNGEPVGLMPQDSTALCCQKLDAIAAWIAAGAPMM